MIHSAIAFAIGCLWIVNQSSLPNVYLSLLLIPAFLIWRKFNIPTLFFLLLGAMVTSWHCSILLEDRLAEEMIGKDILVEGYIDSIPNQQGNRVRFDFRPSDKYQSEIPSKIRLSWYYEYPDALAPNQKWQLLIRLKPPVGMKNPIPFDYERWLFQQGIGAIGYVRKSADNLQHSPAPSWAINTFRYQIFSFLNEHFQQSEHVGLLQALITGLKHNINSEQWEILTTSGTSHLLAISGLHIGLAAAIGFFISGWLWSRSSRLLLCFPKQYAASFGGVITAGFYAAMAGFAVPTQRALLMVIIVLISMCLKRPIAPFQILSFCLLLVLIWDPLAVIDPGFYLSFTAVAIIFLSQAKHYPAPRFTWLKIHGSIALGLTPLLILFFGQTSLIAPFANLLAVPFISLLVVPLLLIAAVLYPLHNDLSAFVFDIAETLLDILWPTLRYCSSLEFASWTMPSLPIVSWLIVCTGTLLLLLPKGMPARRLGIIGLLPLFFYQPEKPKNGEFWFYLLDVGQGLAAVIETKDHTLLFDTGDHFSDSFNAGRHIITPFLTQKGTPHLNAVIISHGDSDHIGGLDEISQHLKVRQIISNEPVANSLPCIAGKQWQWNEVTFDIMHPRENDDPSGNNGSCVLKVSNKAGSVLLTGDIEKETEKLLVKRYAQQLNSTILVAPHHGSKTSSTPEFIKHVSAETVLFPVGYLNRFNHPNPTVLARYEKVSNTLNTAQHGAIFIRFNQQAVEPITTWRQKSQKIWTAKLTD